MGGAKRGYQRVSRPSSGRTKILPVVGKVASATETAQGSGSTTTLLLSARLFGLKLLRAMPACPSPPNETSLPRPPARLPLRLLATACTSPSALAPDLPGPSSGPRGSGAPCLRSAVSVAWPPRGPVGGACCRTPARASGPVRARPTDAEGENVLLLLLVALVSLLCFFVFVFRFRWRCWCCWCCWCCCC